MKVFRYVPEGAASTIAPSRLNRSTLEPYSSAKSADRESSGCLVRIEDYHPAS